MGNVERELLCGVSMSVKQAKQLVDWLSQIIQNIERQHGG
jgi:hypothetical protein